MLVSLVAYPCVVYKNYFHFCFLQTAVNLIFVAEVLQNVKYQAEDEKLSLRWLMKKVSKQCVLEVVRSPFKYSVVGCSFCLKNLFYSY